MIAIQFDTIGGISLASGPTPSTLAGPVVTSQFPVHPQLPVHPPHPLARALSASQGTASPVGALPPPSPYLSEYSSSPGFSPAFSEPPPSPWPSGGNGGGSSGTSVTGATGAGTCLPIRNQSRSLFFEELLPSCHIHLNGILGYTVCFLN